MAYFISEASAPCIVQKEWRTIYFIYLFYYEIAHKVHNKNTRKK